MNTRRLSYGLLLTLATMAAACGDPPAPEVAPQPTAAPAEVAPPPPSAEPAPAPAPTATAAAEAAPPPPAPKPAKEKFAGKFVKAFAGEAKDAIEADIKKKHAKDKGTKNIDADMKKAAEAFAKVTIENTADTHSFTVDGKATHKVKYTVAKEDANALTIKLGQDEIAKKDLKTEVAVTFKDDDTFEMKDPYAKDAKKAQTLVFKRQ